MNNWRGVVFVGGVGGKTIVIGIVKKWIFAGADTTGTGLETTIGEGGAK